MAVSLTFTNSAGKKLDFLKIIQRFNKTFTGCKMLKYDKIFTWILSGKCGETVNNIWFFWKWQVSPL